MSIPVSFPEQNSSFAVPFSGTIQGPKGDPFTYDDFTPEQLAALKGTDGVDGVDGFSPVVTVTDITGGHRVTITDEEGEHSFDVMDGGSLGSVTATVSNTTGVPSVNVTYDGTNANFAFSGIKGDKGDTPSLDGYATEEYVNNHHDDTKQNKLTAGNNITIEDDGTISATGGGGSAVFNVVYGVTTYNEIISAYNAGKVCVLNYNNRLYYLNSAGATCVFLAQQYMSNALNYVTVSVTGNWFAGYSDDAMVEYKLSYVPPNIKDQNGNTMRFGEVKSACDDARKFVYLVYEDRLYIPQYVTADAIYFTCTYPTNTSGVMTRKITMMSNNTVTVNNTELQPKLTAGENITIVDNVISAAGGGGGFSELFKVTLAENTASVEVHLSNAAHFIAVTVIPSNYGYVFEKDGAGAKTYMWLKYNNTTMWIGGNTQGGSAANDMLYAIVATNLSACFTIGSWQNGNGGYAGSPSSSPRFARAGAPTEFKDFELLPSATGVEFKAGTTIEIWGC